MDRHTWSAVPDEPPRKRRRSVEEPTTAQRGHGWTPLYLSQYDERKPIAVIVTPLRKRQGQILVRNLREAGAHVVEPEDPEQLCTGDERRAELLVVTDTLTRAQETIENSECLTAPSVQYVSTKWASKVLSSQTPYPIAPFVLDGKLLTKESHKVEQPKEQSGGQHAISLLPVWCKSSAAEGFTAAKKETMLKRLPTFLCERSTITQHIYTCPNEALCQILESLAKKRVLEQKGGSTAAADIRARTYRLASAALKCVPFKIQTQQDVEALRSFGPRVLAVVNEHLRTGEVQEAVELERDPRLSALAQFQGIYGIGATTARHLYDVSKLRSITQLRERVRQNPKEFSTSTVAYLSHYDSLKHISRQIAVSFTNDLTNIANTPGKTSLHLNTTLCGGFRRGEPSGHDIDVVYCRQDSHSHNHTSLLNELLSRLHSNGLIAAVLAVHAGIDGWHEQKYHGESAHGQFRYAHDVAHLLCRYNDGVFRVDVVGVRDAREFPFATLAWSGSTTFQRDLRSLCDQRHGWIFNQHGVFERSGGSHVQLTPEPRCEMDIFHAIGIVYRPPFERSC